MVYFLIRKLKNKKWMNGCILLGLIMLTGMLSALPMFQNGAYNNLLRNGFENYIREYNKCPAVIGKTKQLDSGQFQDLKAVVEDVEDYQSIWLQYLTLEPETVQTSILLSAKPAKGNYSSGNYYLHIACMPDLEKHIRIVNGNNYTGNSCIISGSLMDRYGLVTGETLTFDMDGEDGKPVELTISGVYDVADPEDLFWYQTPTDLDKVVFVPETLFDMLLKEDAGTVLYQSSMMFDYRDITGKNVEDVAFYLEEFHRLDETFFDGFSGILKDYRRDAKTVSVIIFVLELPVIALLFAFIYMVSNQIMEMEAGEIAMLKSRGAGKWQIVKLYGGQALALNALSFFPGILLGVVFCRIAAAADGFMQFTGRTVSGYALTGKMLVYGFAGLVAADLFMILPVFRHQKASVVEHKQKNVKKKEKPFWNRYYLDVAGMAVTVYLLYSYTRQWQVTALSILQGESVDPVMFLDTVFFILAMGFFSLRLLHLLIRMIYRFQEGKLTPAIYASFLQIIRTFYKQGFLHIFIIMTIAMGSFYANMAQTVNENETERIAYNLGSDMVVAESFPLRIYRPKRDVTLWQYEEPDYGRYSNIPDTICNSMTKVLEDDNVEVRVSGKRLDRCHLMAVHTKEFGETAKLKDGLNDAHWHYALNALGQTPNGVIISENMAEECNLKVGDDLVYSRFSPLKNEEGKSIGAVNGKVCAIVKAWPGHQSYQYEYGEDGGVKESEHYLLVTNYAYTVSVFGITPYKIWMKLGGDGKSALDKDAAERAAQFLADQGIQAEISSIADQVGKKKSSAMIQITNGMFTLSFIVAVILCIVGFFIYWFNSIRQRELLFGIYRAMGMRMEELKKMLVSEQIFSSLSAALFGAGIGILTTLLFARLLAVVYLPMQHNIPVFLVFGGWHLLRLAVLFAVMFIACIRALWHKVGEMRIAQVLKLGED